MTEIIQPVKLYYGMRYLVTGGSGFIGSNLCEFLKNKQETVLSVDLKPSKTGTSTIIHDISLPLEISGDIDVIIHLAGESRVNPSLTKPILTHNSNVTGTLNILELARKKKAKVIYAGSSSSIVDEYLNPYAFTKLKGEEYCKLYSSIYDVSTVVTRFFNVYGPHQIESGDYSTLLGIFEKQYRNKEPLTITGTGENRRDFIHVEDVVSAMYSLSRQKYNGDIYEVGSGENYSVKEIALMFNSPFIHIEKREGEQDVTLSTCNKLNQETGWKPTHDLKDYIKAILE